MIYGDTMFRALLPRTAASAPVTKAEASRDALAGLPSRGTSVPVRDLNRASYPSDAAQAASVRGAVVHQRQSSSNPSWRFRQQPGKVLSGLKADVVDTNNAARGPVSTLNKANMEALGIPWGVAQGSLGAGRKNDQVLYVNPVFRDRMAADTRSRLGQQVPGSRRYSHQVLGHESAHMTQRPMSYDSPGSPEPAGRIVPKEFEAAVRRNQPEYSKRSPKGARAILEREFETSAQELKTQLYHKGIDPYGPKAETALRNLLLKGKDSQLYPGYLRGMPDKDIEKILPLLMHVMKGVAANDTSDSKIKKTAGAALVNLPRRKDMRRSEEMVRDVLSLPESYKLHPRKPLNEQAGSDPLDETELLLYALEEGRGVGPGGGWSVPRDKAARVLEKGVREGKSVTIEQLAQLVVSARREQEARQSSHGIFSKLVQSLGYRR